MRISDWSSDVCSSDLVRGTERYTSQSTRWHLRHPQYLSDRSPDRQLLQEIMGTSGPRNSSHDPGRLFRIHAKQPPHFVPRCRCSTKSLGLGGYGHVRSEEQTSELQSLMRTSYAVFCLNKNKH